MVDYIKSRIRGMLEVIDKQMPIISRSVVSILSELNAIKYTLSDLEDAYEGKIKLLELRIEELKEKIKTLEGGQDNE